MNGRVVGLDRAQQAVNAGGLLRALGERVTIGRKQLTHEILTLRGRLLLDREIAHRVQLPQRTVFQCVARGCDGCSVCGLGPGFLS